MKNTIKRLISLYPKPWRNRYQNEFNALLDDISPTWSAFFNVLGGAMKMQFKSWSAWKTVAAFGLVGILAAVAVTMMIPHRYVSTAVIRTEEPVLMQSGLDRRTLTRIMVEADLYQDLRARLPTEDIAERLKTEDIAIRNVGAKQVVVSVAASNPEGAQRATQLLAAHFLDANVGWLVDPASLPVTPNGPRFSRNVVMGLIAGVVSGSLFALFAGLKVWKLAVGLGLTGAIVGAAIAYLLPERFASTAVIRLTVQKQALEENSVRHLFEAATSDENCRAMIHRFSLYLGESEPERRLREHLHVVFVGNGAAMMIRFDYKDRFIAQKVAGDVVSRLLDEAIRQHGTPSTSMTLELIDPASLSLYPYFPNRPVVVGSGFFVGLAIAILLGVWGRHKRSLPAVAAR